MANIYDYLTWRGDLTFEQDAFNLIDALLLSLLSYAELDGIVPETGGAVTLAEAAQQYFAAHERNEKKDERIFLTRVPYLMETAGACRRYGEIRMSDYADVLDPETSIQMAAVTFRLPDGRMFASFRGTDNSIVGWKEDFEISYGTTNGEKASAEYLDRIYDGSPLLVGGHSKGGNFAQYAAAFCSPEVQQSVAAVYSFDGPGLHDSVRTGEAFGAVASRIVRVVPEQSMIGMIFSDSNEDLVVKSSTFGILQHDAFTWQIKGKEFEQAEELSDMSVYFRDLLKNWLSQIDDETRESFIETVFSFFESTGAETFSQVYSAVFRNVARMIPVYKAMDGQKKQDVSQVMKALFESAVKSAR